MFDKILNTSLATISFPIFKDLLKVTIRNRKNALRRFGVLTLNTIHTFF